MPFILTISVLIKRDEISEVQLPNGKQLHLSPYPTDHYEMEVSLNTSTYIYNKVELIM